MPDNDLSNLPTTIASLVNLKELDISKNGKNDQFTKKLNNTTHISAADDNYRHVREDYYLFFNL